jgi:hypothetical protein
MDGQGLEERIATALSAGVSSEAISNLIGEASAATEEAGQRAEVARGKVLSLTLGRTELARARREMEETAFRRDRLWGAVRQLSDCLEETKKAEDRAQRQAAYDAALTERDAVVEALREYPELAAKLAGILARVVASNRQIKKVNNRLPDGLPPLEQAEPMAREYPLGTSIQRLIPICADHDPCVYPRPVLRVVEQTRWSALDHHVHRTARMGRMGHDSAQIGIWLPRSPEQKAAPAGEDETADA